MIIGIKSTLYFFSTYKFLVNRYYTSRPFYKRMDRVLQDYLRSADLISSVAWLRGLSLSANMADMLYTARSSLALFQHHDGITGTAKDHVVQDYANK